MGALAFTTPHIQTETNPKRVYIRKEITMPKVARGEALYATRQIKNSLSNKELFYQIQK
jgi:hypothetical protein